MTLGVIASLLSAPRSARAVQPLPPDWPPSPAHVDTSGFALILGGGGARGLAHISVIQVLEELGMRPSLIVGTSMGSVVGAMYASGMSSDEMETLALGQDWLRLFVDVETPQADMQGGWWGWPPHQLSLQVDQWPPLPDTGFTHGQGFESLVGTFTADALFHADNDFDRLPIPYRCVSTDLLQYSLVVHDHGSLPRAVKASSTIPMIFHPVELDGRQLVDGGFLDNLPVQVARRLGFDRAVLVDVSNVHLPDKEEPSDIYQMWIRVAELHTYFPNQYTVGEGDVLLRMPLSPYRSMSLEAAGEILTIGRETARHQRDELLALRAACGTAAIVPPTADPVGPVTLRHFDIRGLQRMDEQRVLARLRLQPGDRLELAEVWRRADWLTREGRFQTIGLEFEPVATDTADVVIHVRETTRPQLELGAHLITDDSVAIMGRLRGDNLLGRGGSNLLSYRYSTRESRLDALLDQPIDGAGLANVRARFLWQRERPAVYDNGVKVDRYAFRRTTVGLDLVGRSFQYGWSLYLGMDVGETDSYLESRQFPGTGTQPYQAFRLSLESHGRDLPVPRDLRGVRLGYVHSFGDSGNEPEWWRADLGVVLPLRPFGSWRPVWALGAVASSATIPVVHQGRAGGPRGWVGLRDQEIIAPQIAWTRAALQYLLGSEAHIELAGAAGWSGQEDLSGSSTIWGGGVEAGMGSPIGPLRLGYALAVQRKGYVYLQIGHAF